LIQKLQTTRKIHDLSLSFLDDFFANKRYDSIYKELTTGAAKWFKLISALLSGAVYVVDMVAIKNVSVLIHCSDGWDRTAQLSSLAQLLIDPYYRTFQGFATLLAKEWCSFGHRFAQRCGHGDKRNNFQDSQRSPIFIQFVDCCFQLIRQFHQEFEFNVLFLSDLIDQVQSCRFGTV